MLTKDQAAVIAEALVKQAEARRLLETQRRAPIPFSCRSRELATLEPWQRRIVVLQAQAAVHRSRQLAVFLAVWLLAVLGLVLTGWPAPATRGTDTGLLVLLLVLPQAMRILLVRAAIRRIVAELASAPPAWLA